MNPRARQFSPITWPCLRKSLRSPVANTSAGAGVGPSTSRKRSTRAAFEIDAGEEGSRDALLAIAQKTPRLLGSLYVAREQNHSCGLQTREQGTEPRGHLRAVKADDQELADLLACDFVEQSLMHLSALDLVAQISFFNSASKFNASSGVSRFKSTSRNFSSTG